MEKMDVRRALDILDPDRLPDYSPEEYEIALEMARYALAMLADCNMIPASGEE